MLILMRVISLIMRSLHLNLILFLGNIADSCVRKWWRNMQNWMGFPIPWHGPWCPEVPSIYGHSRLSKKNPQSVHVKKNLHFMNNHYRPGSENLKKKSPSLLYMFLSFFCISQEHVVLNYEYLWEVNRFRLNSP